MTDFTKPRRMGPSAFFIICLKTLKDFKSYFFVIITLMLFKSVEHDSIVELLGKMAISVGIIVALALVTAFVRYYFQKFHIEGDKLVFTRNFLSKDTTSIPLSRVHNIRTHKGLLYQLLDVRGISFDTLASSEKEVELILDETDWQSLLNLVKNGETITDETKTEEPLKAEPLPPEPEERLRVSTSSILKGALCQNHLKGFAILGAILLPILDQINQLGMDTTTKIFDFVGSHVEDAAHVSLIQWLCVLVIIYLVVAVVWTGNAVIRYGEMYLRLTRTRLTMESGIISRFTTRLARDKASVFEMKENPLETLMKCQTVVLLQASNATGKKKEGDIRIYGSMLGKRLLGWWLGQNEIMPLESVATAKSGRGLFYRRFIPHLIIAAVAAWIMVECGYLLAAAILCPVYVVVTALRALAAWRHGGITLTGSFIRVDRGNIARIQDFVKYRDIEAVRLKSTPFTRFTRRKSLSIDTNGKSMTVYALTEESADEIRNLILSQSAVNNELTCNG